MTEGQDILDDLSVLPLKEVEEVCEDENGENQSALPHLDLTETEQKIVSALISGASLMDEVLASTAQPLPEVSATLLKLEIMGVVKTLPGGRFELVAIS